MWDNLKKHLVRALADSDKMSYRFSQVNVPDPRKEDKSVKFDPQQTMHAKTL